MMLMFTFLSFGQDEKVEKEKGKAHMENKEMKHMKMEHHDHEEEAKMYSDKMAAKLSLSAEQKDDLKKAQLKRWESMKELKAEHKEEMAKEDAEDMPKENAEMHEKRMKIQEDFKEDVREILDEAQYAKWETMHNDEMKMHNEKEMHHDQNNMKGKQMKMKMKDHKDEKDNNKDYPKS